MPLLGPAGWLWDSEIASCSARVLAVTVGIEDLAGRQTTGVLGCRKVRPKSSFFVSVRPTFRLLRISHLCLA